MSVHTAVSEKGLVVWFHMLKLKTGLFPKAQWFCSGNHNRDPEDLYKRCVGKT